MDLNTKAATRASVFGLLCRVHVSRRSLPSPCIRMQVLYWLESSGEGQGSPNAVPASAGSSHLTTRNKLPQVSHLRPTSFVRCIFNSSQGKPMLLQKSTKADHSPLPNQQGLWRHKAGGWVVWGPCILQCRQEPYSKSPGNGAIVSSLWPFVVLSFSVKIQSSEQGHFREAVIASLWTKTLEPSYRAFQGSRPTVGLRGAGAWACFVRRSTYWCWRLGWGGFPSSQNLEKRLLTESKPQGWQSYAFENLSRLEMGFYHWQRKRTPHKSVERPRNASPFHDKGGGRWVWTVGCKFICFNFSSIELYKSLMEGERRWNERIHVKTQGESAYTLSLNGGGWFSVWSQSWMYTTEAPMWL